MVSVVSRQREKMCMDRKRQVRDRNIGMRLTERSRELIPELM